ncbi:MAG: IS66 family insertion sequence element accessory protein TnpA [Luteimonas sp.]
MANRAEKRAIWCERVQAFEASGLTRRAFCAARGLNAHTLDSWRRRLRSEAAVTPNGSKRVRTTAAVSAKRVASATFVALRVRGATASPAPAVTSAVERAALSLHCGGVRLDLPRDLDASWVATLLRGLR